MQDKYEFIRKILEAQARFDRFTDGLHRAGVGINFDIDLFDYALDLLGVPKDNSDSLTGEIPEGGYCRDWAYGDWNDCDYNPDDFIELVKDHLSDISAH